MMDNFVGTAHISPRSAIKLPPPHVLISLLLAVPIVIQLLHFNIAQMDINPIDFISSSNLSEVDFSIDQSEPGFVGITRPPRFDTIQPSLFRFGVTSSFTRPPIVLASTSGRANSSAIRNVTPPQTSSVESNTADPLQTQTKLRGGQATDDPSWFSDRPNSGFFCTFCIENHLHSDNIIWTDKPCTNSDKKVAIRKH